MATLQSTENLFNQEFTIQKQSGTTYLLSTAGTYVDKDIQLISNVRSANITLGATGSANISSITCSYNSSADNFNVIGSTNLSGTATLAIAQTGWIETGSSALIKGTASLSGITIPKINIKASTSGTLYRVPTISRTTTTAANAVNVGSTAATTAVPSQGYFVSVRSATATNKIGLIPSVVSAGYGDPTTGHYAVTSATATFTTRASAITYIPIASGTATAGSATADISLFDVDGSNNGKNISASVGTKVEAEPTSGYYIALTASGSGNSEVTQAGWFQKGALASSTTTSNVKYFPIQSGGITIAGGGLTPSSGHTSLVNNGYYNGSTYDTTDVVDITSQTTAANGYYKLTSTGYGTVTRTAVTKQVTQAGYVDVEANATQIVAGASGTSNSATATYYIKKSTINTTNVTPSTSNQTVTISEGYYPTSRTVTIKAMTSVTPTTSYANANLSDYFTAGTQNDYSISITPRYSNTAGYVSAHTNTNNGGIGYWKIKTTSITQTDSVINEDKTAIISRGIASWGTGWITQGSITPATFSNRGTIGVTYIDISNTPAAPVLTTTDGFLYINRGYVDNLKINFGTLIPDDEITVKDSDEVENGKTTIDSDGNLITGTIQERKANDLTAVGPTVYVPSGYYKTDCSKTIGNGTYAAGVSLSSVTVTPSVSISDTATYGFTTVAPTTGTYITITPESDTPTYSATGTAIITSAGYLTTGSKADGTSATVKVGNTVPYYAKVVAPTFSGGGLSGSTTTTITTTGMNNSTTATNYYIDASATGSCSRAAVKYSNDAGVIAKHTNTNAISAGSRDMGSSATRIYIPEAKGSITLTAGSGYCDYNSTSSVNVVVSDINTSGVAITFDGSGEVDGVAQVTTAGYTPINNSFAATTTATKSDTASLTKYITGVTIEAPSTANTYNIFEITVPNGSPTDFITFRFSVDSSGNVFVDGPD